MINLRMPPQRRRLDASSMEKTGVRGFARAAADGKSAGEKRRKKETVPRLRLHGTVHCGIRFGMRRNHVLQVAVAAPPSLCL